MIKKAVERIVRKVQEGLINEGYDKLTLVDLRIMVYDRINNNYEKSWNTRAYKFHSVAYCRALEYIEEYFTE